MELNEFIKSVEELASGDADNLRQIQSLITCYYRDKGAIMFPCNNQYIVRASLNDDEEIFSHISRCSYNPVAQKIRLQRCNYPGQQVFYCSMYTNTDMASTSMTCLMETAKETIDNNINRKYITLSRWEVTRPLNLWVLPFSEVSCNKNRDFKSYRDEAMEEIKKYKTSAEVIKSLEYMSNVFCEEKDKKLHYKISSAYFNSLLFYEKLNGHFCEGLAYPSANTEGAGINVVLKKELVDTKVIYCSSATMFLMKRNPYHPEQISFMPASDTAFTKEDGSLAINIFKNDVRVY